MTAGTSVAAAGLGAAGQIIQGQGQAESQLYQAQAAKYQQQVAKNSAEVAMVNAGFAQGDADRAIARGHTAAEMQDQKTAAVMGEQIAAQSVSGIDVGRGSAALTRASTHLVGRQDTKVIRDNANIDAFNSIIQKYNTEAQAAGQLAQADLYGMAAKNYENSADNTMLATYINVGASLLGSASSTAEKYNMVTPTAAA